MKRIVFAVLLLAVVAGVVCTPMALFAGEVPPISAADFDGQAANAIWSVLAGQGTWGALLFAIIGVLYAIFKPLLSSYVQRHLSVSQWNSVSTLYAVAETAVMGVKQVYVDAVKAANTDGKVTPEEAEQARKMARQFIVDHFKANGVDILKDYSHEMLDLIIESIIGKWNANSVVQSVAKAVALPLPDLGPSAPSV